LGGYVLGSLLMGWLNDNNSNIGNPDPEFDGIGPYDTYQVMAMVGTSTAFLYYTFGSNKIVTSNGHIRHIIDVMKEQEMPPDHETYNYAVFRAVQIVINIALTGGSPVIFEILIAGAVINQSTHNIGYWILTEFVSFMVAVMGLFCNHHFYNHYTLIALHVRSKDLAVFQG
jgi:hypothetical protein